MEENKTFECVIMPWQVLADVIIKRIKELNYKFPRAGSEAFKVWNENASEVITYDDITNNSCVEFFIPESITPESANEWRQKKVEQLKVEIVNMGVKEFVDKYDNSIDDTELGDKAKALLETLKELTFENVSAPSASCPNSWYSPEHRDEPHRAAQHPMSKAIFSVLNEPSQESAVDGFVRRLLAHIGYDDDWLLVREQHELKLRFGKTLKTSKADFIVKDLLSFFRMAVVEDKSYNGDIDSFPQLVADLIAVHQANVVQESIEPVAKKQKVGAKGKDNKSETKDDAEAVAGGDAEDAAKTVTEGKADEVPEPIVGVRVNGLRFWFFLIYIGRAIDNAMENLCTALSTTEVFKIGDENGFDFCKSGDRETVIRVLDAIRRVLIKFGPSRGRLNSA